MNGDGCSQSCMQEDGYICRGGNTTYVAADFCNIGEYMLNINFEQTNYNPGTDGSAVDTTLYDVAKWKLNCMFIL